MGFLVNTGFDVGSSNPIDSRTVKNTTDERDALISDGLVNENLKVYCKDTQTEYRWTGTKWETVGSSSGGTAIDDTHKAVQSTFGKRNKMRLIAHRGFKSNQPENSYESLHEAAARGYWGVECDIQETSDGEYVIMHDSTVDRTTSGTGEVSSKTLAEIKELTLTDSLYGVPVFEEWLMITKTYGIVPVIEIKNLTDPNKFVQILRDTGVIYNCIVISFEKTALEQVYNIDSKISVSYVVKSMTTDTIDEVIESFGEGNSICPYWGSCTEELVKYAFSKNIEVIPWTLNTIEDYSKALKMGLNCIETETFPTGDPLKNDISTGKINIFPNPIIEVEDEPFKLTFSRFVHTTDALESSGKFLPCWECRSYCGVSNGNSSGQSLLPEFVFNAHPRNGSYQIIKIPEGAERITTDLDLTTYKWTFQQFNIDGIVMQDIGWVTTKSANILDGAKYGYVYVNLIKEGKLTNGQLSTLNNATFNFPILETKRVYNSLEELNTAKGLSISFINGEDNTMKIVDALSPIEPFAEYFNNCKDTNRFGIDANTYGTDISLLTITKFHEKATIIRAFMSNGKLLVRRYRNGVFEDWVYDKGNSSDFDVPKTTLTPVFPDAVKVGSGGVAINYVVKNGWCNVNFEFNLASATTFPWTGIATGLPIPANNVNTLLTDETGKLNRNIAIRINSTGTVAARIQVQFTANDWWYGNISYPVAES